MTMKVKDHTNRLAQGWDSPLFLRAARCTNAGAFVILPSSPDGASGSEASELGFCFHFKNSRS